MKRPNPAKALSEKYRSGSFHLTEEEKRAYIDVRFPATSAALQFVFQRFLQRLSRPSLDSVVDCGSGPGTLIDALDHLDIKIPRLILLEKDLTLIRLGQELFPEHTDSFFHHDLLKGDEPAEEADLVLFSYSLNEIPSSRRKAVIDQAFQKAKRFVVVVEPGTPQGYHSILSVRDQLIALGGKVIAPCPHSEKCPLSSSDWCHFAARVERSKVHRQLKEGELSFEDEKFSYVVVSKEEGTSCEERILRKPVKRKGLVEVDLCTRGGLQHKKYAKSNSENFKNIKKMKWGDNII